MDVIKIFLDQEEDLKLYMYCYTSDTQVVDDTYQEAYLKLHKYVNDDKRKFYGNENSVKSLLQFMVRNMILDKHRKNNTARLSYTDESYDMVDYKLPDDDVDRAVQLEHQKIINKKLSDAFNNMNKDVYMTYKLRIKGFKFKDIAYLTDTTTGTAIARMRYATRRIEREFNTV